MRSLGRISNYRIYYNVGRVLEWGQRSQGNVGYFIIENCVLLQQLRALEKLGYWYTIRLAP
jgi:hypothetical protein